MEIFKQYAPLYASRGLPVFPCMEGGKEPRIPHHNGGKGCLDATTDLVRLGFWADSYPNANVALACGVKSDILVADIDAHHGGFETIEALENEGYVLPQTKTAKTPRGGRHLFFRNNPRIRNSQSKLGPGIDIRAEGGYVLLAPSFFAEVGKGYEWITPKSVPLAELPSWAVEKLDPPREPPKPRGPLPTDQGDDYERVRKALCYISADERENLIAVGMAIAARFGAGGRELFDTWASQSAKFTEQHQNKVWRSFRGGARSLGTIFYLRSLSRGQAPLYNL